jgi:hypothetical protein
MSLFGVLPLTGMSFNFTVGGFQALDQRMALANAVTGGESQAQLAGLQAVDKFATLNGAANGFAQDAVSTELDSLRGLLKKNIQRDFSTFA